MNKETEEIILLVVGGFFLLSLLRGGGIGAGYGCYNPVAMAQVNAQGQASLVNAIGGSASSIINAFTGN